MSFLKKLLYYCLLAGIVLVAIEGMARVAYYAAWGEGYDPGRPGDSDEFYPSPPPTAPPYDSAVGQIIQPIRVFHPYYGHTPVAPWNEQNVMPPPGEADDAVVIGVMGGSVAHHVMPAFRRAVYRYFLDNDLGRRPVVVNLAYLSVKQPQQVMITANILLLGGEFDLLVNLDGYNETRYPVEFDSPVEPLAFPFMPAKWNLFNLTAGETLLFGRIHDLRAAQLARERAAQGGFWRHTAVFGIINRYQEQRIERQIAGLYQELESIGRQQYSLQRFGPRREYQSLGEVLEGIARFWYLSSLLLADLAELSGAEYYHFLQPNQYIPNTKPLSQEELAKAYVDDSDKNLYRRGYPLLARQGASLRRQGINYFDLTRIYADIPETIYIDRCCHVNERGNELLAAAILRRLEPALRPAAGKAADEPVSGLTAAQRPAPADKLLLNGDFRVYRRGSNWLAYVKEGCTPEERAAKFFLHITPVDAADLPPARREHGFDNRDFAFAEAGGGMVEGKCVVERRLPSYPIASVHTGQYDRRGIIWSGEVPFQE